MTTASVSLTWPLAAWPNSNADRRKHWTRQRREARAIRQAARIEAARLRDVIAPAVVQLHGPVAVTLRFAFPDARHRDLDNYSAKALIDGLVDSGILADDDHRHIASVTRTLDPIKTLRGHLRVTVEIEELA